LKFNIRVLFFLLLLSIITSAKSLYNDHLVAPKAADYIEKMGSELKNKTGINGYLIVTNKKIKRGVSVYDFIKSYKDLKEPFVAIVFAPNSQRIHLISIPKEFKKSLDESKILDNAIDIIISKDSNSQQSKYDVGLVQAFSEMADEIAKTKGVSLQSTIKDGGGWILKIVNTLIILGSIVVIWFYFIKPMINKRRE